MNSSKEEESGLTLLQVIGSSLMAGLGVQKKSIRERDFTKGDIKQFIAAGLILTGCFLAGMIYIVHLVIENAA